MFRIDRINRVKRKFDTNASSTIYSWVSNETLTKPVKIGNRASGWPEHEVDAILAARIAGKTQAEIQQLVRDLMAKRGQILNGLAA